MRFEGQMPPSILLPSSPVHQPHSSHSVSTVTRVYALLASRLHVRPAAHSSRALVRTIRDATIPLSLPPLLTARRISRRGCHSPRLLGAWRCQGHEGIVKPSVCRAHRWSAGCMHSMGLRSSSATFRHDRHMRRRCQA
ncbi:hypothetical protein WOLCODRAFT_136737 [Wolfiporia cocos MD-104 SS10]|uniref:Uncharacterized protein n=1 Tax=Wolfiporia cocos (strain MD-104) TaxID=742152 RepID=A0A2H3JDA6_WOLCO|nr:hypothetical protein WOLCODRAFT_136737 [Wolfiporia cocos MD-104 SS10]